MRPSTAKADSILGFTNVTTDANGDASFDAAVLPGSLVTATATDPNGNTSEFSQSIGQLLNVSTRLHVRTGDDVLIGGFIVRGRDPKRVIVRGLGPSPVSKGVSDALQNPTLELYDGAGHQLAFNDDWKDSQQVEIEATKIPPTDDREAAVVRSLPANDSAYTAVVRGKGDTVGTGLVEAYDLDQAANSSLANISTRGFVESGDTLLIGGFIVGNGTERVIVRALGPSLSSSGVTSPLPDPTLDVRDGNGNRIGFNDNWRTNQEAEINATGIPPANDAEAAVVAILPPGPAPRSCAARIRQPALRSLKFTRSISRWPVESEGSCGGSVQPSVDCKQATALRKRKPGETGFSL